MNRLRIRITVVMAAFIALPAAARSQTPVERSVRAVVDSFFHFVDREKWDSAARLIDTVRFAPYFKEVMGNARSALPPVETTAEAIMARDSTMPRAVAEWQVAQMKKYETMRPEFGDLSSEFAGVHSQKELFALKLPDAIARWIEAQDERTQMREAFRRLGCSLAVLPNFPGAQHDILGVTVPNDSVAYAVQLDERFRTSPAPLYTGESVIPLHRTDGAWRIEPRMDLLRPLNWGWGGMDCPRSKKP